MEYSPLRDLPRVSRVDAGILELVRSFGIEVVPSGDIQQYATQRWVPRKLQWHSYAAKKLGTIVSQAFEYIGNNISGLTEFEVA